ncbi:MAG: cysteine--tRNA ligase [Minisyncoccia bacterium]|jgi:cysteinyl-tRNA synthetase
MRIWNTLSGKKEELIKPEGRSLHLFVCGPTVYDYSHIGHARTYIAYDAFVRYVREKNWEVFYLQNITDVDDKIINRAKSENKKPGTVAKFFTQAHLDDMRALGIDTVDKYAPASHFIPQIVKQVETLKKKGFAYEIPGDGIYYDITKFQDYGKLSHRTTLQAEDAVSRIDESVKKRNKGDFVLWKFPKTPIAEKLFSSLRRFTHTRDGEPAWKTPLGWGRPGWHIEDTAITESFFGPQYDIHGGAVELKFPHHEAEIAQQEAASGISPLVKVWMHTGLLTINGQKMSKSLKNFISIRDALEKHSPAVLRWFFLNHHYRMPMNYSPEDIGQTKAVYNKTRIFLDKMDFVSKGSEGKKLGMDKFILESRKKFEGALEDDFNTPLAISVLLGTMGEFQERIWSMEPSEAREMEKHLADSFKTLGIDIKTEEVPQNVKKLAIERELSRTNKQFVQSDALREKIRVLGYGIEDTPHGPFVYKE